MSFSDEPRFYVRTMTVGQRTRSKISKKIILLNVIMQNAIENRTFKNVYFCSLEKKSFLTYTIYAIDSLITVKLIIRNQITMSVILRNGKCQTIFFFLTHGAEQYYVYS